ncbi:MAG: ArnT family glycosyltransferase [Anaerolineae bacterium]
MSLTRRATLVNLILILVLLLALARYLAVGWNRILANSNSSDGDQAAYLQLGLDLREQGTLTDGKRNPLYPALLSLFAERTWSYFTWAKIVNLAAGLVTLGAVYAAGRRLFNRATAVLAVFLLSINMEFILHNTFALAEALLILCVFLAWFAMVRALQNPDRARAWLIAGGLAGLAFLAKGTAPLIAAGFGVSATLLHGPRLWRGRSIWGFALGFVLVSSPLWLYNWVSFGSPVYNSAVNNVMWMDSAEEKYIADESELPTLATYLQTSSLAQVWQRLGGGLLDMRFFFAKLLWPARSLTLDRFLLAGGLDVLLAVAAVGLALSWRFLAPVARRNRESLLLTATLVGIFYVVFGWYLAIAPFPIRFLLVLLPALLLLLSAALAGLAAWVWASPRLPRWGKLAGGVLALVLALWIGQWFVISGALNARGAWRNPFLADAAFNDFNEQSLRWVQAGHTAPERVAVLWGPSHNLPIWQYTDHLEFLRTPLSTATLAQLEAFMEANDIAYVIADDDMARRRPGLAAEMGLSRREGELLEVGDFPQDWALGFTGPGAPCRWCVFRRLSAGPPIAPVSFVLGDAIELVGYELDAGRFYPAGQVVVTLYWRSVRPVSTDYTVFTQLLGPDFQLHGQMDRQPLSGHWPTHRWRPGQHFADKFIIDVDESAPAGDYVLLVGLYDLNTGQRLPVVSDGAQLPDDAIPLASLTLEDRLSQLNPPAAP